MWLLCCLLFPLFAGMVSMAEACLHVWRLKPVLLLSSVQLRFVLRFLLGILEPHPLTLSIGGAQVSCHREGNSSFGGRKEKFIVARSKWYDNHSASPILSCCVASEFANYWAKKTARLWCLRGTSGPDRKIQGSWPQGWCRWLGKQCHWRTLGRRGGIFAMRWYDRVWYLSTRWSKVVQASRNDGLDLQAVNPRALVASSSSSASAAAARVIHNITTSNHFDWNTLYPQKGEFPTSRMIVFVGLFSPPLTSSKSMFRYTATGSSEASTVLSCWDDLNWPIFLINFLAIFI